LWTVSNCWDIFFKKEMPEAMVVLNLLVHFGIERQLLSSYSFSKSPVVIAGFGELRLFLPFWFTLTLHPKVRS
jgi:hypothetical protein